MRRTRGAAAGGGELDGGVTACAEYTALAGAADGETVRAAATGYLEAGSCLAGSDGGKWQTLCVSGAPACAGDGLSCGSQQE